MSFDNYRLLAMASHHMGQTLFVPPNVKGWPGGKDWIDSNTLLIRQEFLRRAARGMQRRAFKMGRRMGMGSEMNAVVSVGKVDMAGLPQVLLAATPMSSNAPNMVESGGDSVQANGLEKILLDPVYQLK